MGVRTRPFWDEAQDEGLGRGLFAFGRTSQVAGYS